MKVSATESKKDGISISVSTEPSNTNTCKGSSHATCYTQVSPPLNQVLREQPVTDSSVVDSVRLNQNQIIMATADRVWVYSPDSGNHNNFLPQPSTSNSNIGNIEATKKLLDTAIILGKRAASVERRLPDLNLTTWIWSLVSQYHTTQPTPQLMKEAAQRFEVKGRHCLAEWAEEKALEETGHDRLALLDIQSLGYQAQAVVNTFMPPSAKVLVDYFIRSVQTSDPIRVVGYSYTLERIALAVQEKHIQAIEAIIPSGINATRCLRVHSSIGSDVEHVAENLEIIAASTPAERNDIAIACYETAKRYFSIRENDYPSTTEQQQKLEAFKY
ncbi:conserved hypothetical protein [Hyella patelloides LEGE 07179]|uniref:Uncharacterized protein n=1 Tax=Hyella patelloides LEGE 07179 TaxID=945734 RepID=A0A563VNJ6_9CYAN|nr:hypothetical protein [Hyella patelloides]VEP12982.1 conserved hypothetical protein [Hyella patelloides LEGE 07179]